MKKTTLLLAVALFLVGTEGLRRKDEEEAVATLATQGQCLLSCAPGQAEGAGCKDCLAACGEPCANDVANAAAAASGGGGGGGAVDTTAEAKAFWGDASKARFGTNLEADSWQGQFDTKNGIAAMNAVKNGDAVTTDALANLGEGRGDWTSDPALTTDAGKINSKTWGKLFWEMGKMFANSVAAVTGGSLEPVKGKMAR